MKKIIAFMFACAVAVCSMAQLPVGINEPYPPSLNGTMMPIDLPIAVPAVPDSLKPLFVSHLGRHGARFLTSPAKVDALSRMLESAQASATITSAGRSLMELLGEVKRATAGRWGALDSLGAEEERLIAEELNSMLPGFFENGNIVAISTYVPRAVGSMYSFCHELGKLNPGLQISASSGPAYNGLLRFFDTDKDFAKYLKHGAWKDVYEEYAASVLPITPARRLLGDNAGLPDSKMQEFSADLYSVLQALPAMGLSAPISEFMTPAEYRACYEVSNLRHALRYTDTSLSDLPGKSARVLLSEMLKSMDEALENPAAKGLIQGEFRFAHAETLMPFLSLIRLPGCAVGKDVKPAELSESWNASFVTPLGANFIVIVYSSPSGKKYAQTLLNGRECLSMPSATDFIVSWDSLREYWGKCLGR